MKTNERIYKPYEGWKVEDGYCVGQPVIWDGCEPQSSKEDPKCPNVKPIYSSPRGAYIIHVSQLDILYKYCIVFAVAENKLCEKWVIAATLKPRPVDWGRN